MLQTLDELWKSTWRRWITYVKVSIYVVMRKRSKTRVQKESFRMFTEMLDSLKHHDYDTYSSEGPYTGRD